MSSSGGVLLHQTASYSSLSPALQVLRRRISGQLLAVSAVFA